MTASGGSFDCSFPDGPNSSTVAIKVTDNNGGSDTASEAVQIVAVANVAPSVTAAADQSSNEGASHSFNLGSFSDPGDDSPWNVTVDWGDGSFPLTSFTATSTGTIAATSHTYADGPNDYTVTVSVNDGTDTTSKTLRGAREQRRAVDRDQRQRERQRGLGLQPDARRGHRSGHGHGFELRRPLG